jgi:hypothetical protein
MKYLRFRNVIAYSPSPFPATSTLNPYCHFFNHAIMHFLLCSFILFHCFISRLGFIEGRLKLKEPLKKAQYLPKSFAANRLSSLLKNQPPTPSFSSI